MMNFTNQKLMTTVPIVRVSQMGMKMSGRFDAVSDTPVPAPLEKREGKKDAAANPSIMTVMSKSRRGEDFFATMSLACDPS